MSSSAVLLSILGGVGLLLWGVRMVRTGMMRAFGRSLRYLVADWGQNRFKIAAAGGATAAAVQSSTAVALIGSSFASRGALTTAAGLGLMLGADVGAAIGAQVFASGVAQAWPVLAIAGYLMHTLSEGRSLRLKHLGRVLLGLAILLLALNMIAASAAQLTDSEVLADLLAAIAGEPLLAMLIAAGLTWLAHSSLALILLLASLASAGLLEPQAMFPLVLGVNAGAALPAMTATAAEPREARRIPLGNLLFRVCGVVLAWALLSGVVPDAARLIDSPAQQVVTMHVLFNVALLLLFIGMTGPAAKLVSAVLPTLEHDEETFGPRHLDEKLFDTASVAIGMAARETLRMGDEVESMLTRIITVFRDDDTALLKEINESEDRVDCLHQAIKLYLTRLTRNELDDEESRRAIDVIIFTTNLEHCGDIVVRNLVDLASKKVKHQHRFSEQGFAELAEMHAVMMETVRMSLSVFMSQDLDTARALLARKKQFRALELQGTEAHLERLRTGHAASLSSSTLHLDILRDFKRINSHLTSVAYPILDRAGELRDNRLRSASATPSREVLDDQEPLVTTPQI